MLTYADVSSDDGGLGFLPCDAYAACVLEEEDIVVASRDLYCGVELGSSKAVVKQS